jgi:hypothetical protein
MSDLLLPAGKGEQQQGAIRSYSEKVQPWHPFLGKGDTFEIW